jgi:Copper binding proteins, plastocyanin/azurin family
VLRKKRLLALSAAALAAMSLGLAACGGDDSSSNDTTTEAVTPATTAPSTTAPTTPTPATTAAGAPIAVDADPSGALAFTQKTLTANPSFTGEVTGTTPPPVGTATFTFTNDSPVPHDFAIEVRNTKSVDRLGVTKRISNGASENLTVDLPAGEYTYLCTVPGHEQAGMKGTLTVQ